MRIFLMMTVFTRVTSLLNTGAAGGAAEIYSSDPLRMEHGAYRHHKHAREVATAELAATVRADEQDPIATWPARTPGSHRQI